MVLEWDRASAFADTTTGEDDAARGKAGVTGVDLLPFTVVDISCCVLETGVECWEEMEGAVNAVAESVLERIRIAAVKSNRPSMRMMEEDWSESIWRRRLDHSSAAPSTVWESTASRDPLLVAHHPSLVPPQ